MPGSRICTAGSGRPSCRPAGCRPRTITVLSWEQEVTESRRRVREDRRPGQAARHTRWTGMDLLMHAEGRQARALGVVAFRITMRRKHQCSSSLSCCPPRRPEGRHRQGCVVERARAPPWGRAGVDPATEVTWDATRVDLHARRPTFHLDQGHITVAPVRSR